MVTRIAAKRLTASDLTLFAWHLRNRPAGKQKAINLNANVIAKQLYPALLAPENKEGRFPLDLDIYGPGNKPKLNLQRKIIRQEKNWRLNGEFIENPQDDPARFDELVPGDFAIIAFAGVLLPSSAKIVLVSAKSDERLVGRLDAMLGTSSMSTLGVSELQRLAEGTPQNHPVHLLTLSFDLEDVGFGGAAPSHLGARDSARTISRSDLAQAKRAAEDTGLMGERLVWKYLRRQRALGVFQTVRWAAQRNAVAPYDFEVVDRDGAHRLVEVKSTVGSFQRSMHFSRAEVHVMSSAANYDVYRLYNVSIEEECADFRIATGLADLASTILRVADTLPDAAVAEGFAIYPSLVTFGPSQELGGV